MDSRYRTVGAFCGLLAVASFLALYSIAMSLDSDYEFGENYLSDLGVGDGAWAFNSGVILAAILFLLFDLLTLRFALGTGRRAALTTATLVVGALFLLLVGVFTEDAGDIHLVVSYGFFLTMLVALAMTVPCMRKSRYLGHLGYLIPLVLFLLGLSLLPMGGSPLSETLAVLGIIFWGLVMSTALLLKEMGYRIP